MNHALVLNRSESRLVDQIAIEEYGIPGIVLMENAGRGIVDVMRSVGVQGPVAIWCGPGNNGGDGFVIARHLHNLGIDTHIALLAEPERLQGDALTNYQIIKKMGLPVELNSEHLTNESLNQLDQSEWAIDCLLGTGATGEPRGNFASAINALNASRGKRLAVDIPSGLDCDSGDSSSTTIRADHTCMMASAKPMLGVSAAKPFLGDVHIVDIGVPKEIFERIIAKRS